MAPTAVDGKIQVWDVSCIRCHSTAGQPLTRTQPIQTRVAEMGIACEQCHGPDMSGDQVEEIPSLVLDSFMIDWNGKSVRELFETVKRSMPKDKPGSLGTGAYVDLVAYLLQANKFPSGAKELSRTPEQLEPIVIERGKTP